MNKIMLLLCVIVIIGGMFAITGCTAQDPNSDQSQSGCGCGCGNGCGGTTPASEPAASSASSNPK